MMSTGEHQLNELASPLAAPQGGSDLRGDNQDGVCIFGEFVAETLKGIKLKGGAELQMGFLAKTLASHGIRVTIIDPQAHGSCSPTPHLAIQGVPNWVRGVRGIRFFTHRVPALIKSLRATGAKVFYCRGFSFVFLVPLCVARYSRAQFCLAVASDAHLVGFRERYSLLYKGHSSLWSWISTIIPDELVASILLRFSDILLVQHEDQRTLARSRSGRVLKLSNIIGDEVFDIKAKASRTGVIVVGTFSVYKGLRVLLPVVGRLQDVTFEFIGVATDTEGEEVMAALSHLPNVRLHGGLDRNSTLERIAGAKALVNTSPREGFPNTFIEAWALGTPVVSLFVDPGGLIEEHRLGYVCKGDVAVLEGLLRQDRYDLDMERIKTYVKENHSGESAVHIFDEIMRKVS